MDLPVNRFKQALKDGQQQIGLWNSIPGPLVAEALAGCGFDWVVIDTEHAPTDVPDVLGMLQAMAPYPVSAVVRPAANDPVLIKRLLDFGAQTLILPYIQSAEEAQAAVAEAAVAEAAVAAPKAAAGANGTGAAAVGAAAEGMRPPGRWRR